ncbi:MAG: ABC transporter ATP-binding protein [Chloroflexi bacterium]|nr:ABC transporter ATP-binding protein [Chloroflexota bacterium]
MTQQNTKPILEVDNLRTHFFTRNGVVKAVDGISFKMHEGETLGIVGESGCGKSITALSLMKLIPHPGKVVTGNIHLQTDSGMVDVTQISDRQMADIRGNKIAMIFQEPMTSLNPVLTIGYQLTEPLKLHLDMNDEQARKQAVDLLKRVGIPAASDRLGDYPHQFSGGMRQRVMVAMAIACTPLLLLADEPTTALDVTIQAQILDLIRKMNTDLGVGVVLITHDLGVVADLCQRVIVMYAGQIIEEAPIDDIFNRPAHHYTIGLLRSVPKLGVNVKERLIPMKGLPPDLLNPPAGCRFYARCPARQEKCKEQPPLTRVSAQHQVACWFPQERPA